MAKKKLAEDIKSSDVTVESYSDLAGYEGEAAGRLRGVGDRRKHTRMLSPQVSSN